MEAKTLKEGLLDETQEERKERRGKGPGSQAEEKEGRRTMIGRIQEVLTNQQLDEEIGWAEEREEWRTQQWQMTRKEELFDEAMRTAEMVGEQMAAKLSEDGC